MPDYRRRLVPGGSWFFTVTLLDRRSALLTDNIAALREATRWTLRRYPFRIDAFVALPEHLHAIWTLPEDDTDFSTRWRMIKTRFVRSLPNTERLTRSRIERGERGIWQRRFWEHHLRTGGKLTYGESRISPIAGPDQPANTLQKRTHSAASVRAPSRDRRALVSTGLRNAPV